VRIIAGKFKGKSIDAPAGMATRPTADRVRESLFNVLEHAPWAKGFADARVLDLFAGSGAFGLESISRGAAFALFVDTAEAARGAIRRNVEAMQLFGVTRIHRRGADDLGPRPAGLGAPFDLVFLDPPYRMGLAEKALGPLRGGGWVSEAALAVVERGSDEPAAPVVEGWTLLDDRAWGPARVAFLKAS
jgi:16S rRNA (guanine966-N2)-methyltransferase